MPNSTSICSRPSATPATHTTFDIEQESPDTVDKTATILGTAYAISPSSIAKSGLGCCSGVAAPQSVRFFPNRNSTSDAAESRVDRTKAAATVGAICLGGALAVISLPTAAILAKATTGSFFGLGIPYYGAASAGYAAVGALSGSVMGASLEDDLFDATLEDAVIGATLKGAKGAKPFKQD